MKKIITILLTLALLLSFAACGNTEAPETTAAPATQAATEAPTTVPPTTEPPCVHDWADANYQTPKTCTICGETEGEVLTPEFETLGLVVNATELDTPYDYVTNCANQPEVKTVGQAVFTNYAVSESHGDYEAMEGYEWLSVDVIITFADENSFNYGMNTADWVTDYYAIASADKGTEVADGVYSCTVNFNGAEYADCMQKFDSFNFEWVDNAETGKRECICTTSVAVRAPVGYDGFVLGLYNAANVRDDAEYITDIADADTVFFRFSTPAFAG